MELYANWSYPTTIRFGAGRIRELGAACRDAGMSRPLLVTDPGIAGLEMTRRALDSLLADGLGVAVFSEVSPNPTGSNVDSGVAVLREGGHDGVVAFGGGSALDVGKLIAFMSAQIRPIWDFEDIGDLWKRADREGILPIVAVPTTAGTGSEVGRAGVVTNEQTHTKKIIFHPDMLPQVVIADAELTRDLPPLLTAGTGFDAFAHCLEAYCSPAYHPMSTGIAVEGMRLIKQYLPRACHDGHDLEARAHMLSAAAMGAVAFQKGLGGIHSLSHPVGALYNTHHGLTNAMFAPYVLESNRSAIETRIARLTAWLDIDSGFDGFMRFVLDLRQALAIPNTLKELGIPDPDIPRLAAMAAQDPTAAGNPIPLTVARCSTLLEAALRGSLSAA